MPRYLFRTLLMGGMSVSGPLLAACNGPLPAAATFVSRDSAGVKIWEHPDLSHVAADAWTLAETPVLILGEEVGETPFLFSRIRSVVPFPSGGVAVADGLSNEIRVFDEDGTHLRTFGGTGSGPGEFTRLRNAFGYRGDSVVATNALGGTIHVFSPQGELGRSLTCEPASPSLTGLRIEGTLKSGGFLIRAMKQLQSEAPTEGLNRESSAYQLCFPDGSAGILLTELPDLEFGTLAEDGRLMSYPLEMGRKAASAVVGDAVMVGVTDRLELWRYGPDGVLTGLLRVGTRPTPMTEEIKSRITDLRLGALENADAARAARKRYRTLPWPDSLPVFSELRGDFEGNLWVRRFAPDYAEGPSEWWVFGPNGAFRARATLPANLQVAAIGSDFVLGVMADELGVERVFQFRLQKATQHGLGP